MPKDLHRFCGPTPIGSGMVRVVSANDAPTRPALPAGIREWTPDKDKWELYRIDEDWSQANDLADKMPAELAD
jgi:arylsulfatase A-like enzyme